MTELPVSALVVIQESTSWRYAFEHRLRSGSMAPAFEAHLGKYRKLVPALAVLIHVAEWQTSPVTLSALERALAWADCLESHAARVFGSGIVAECDAARTLLKSSATAPLPCQPISEHATCAGKDGPDSPARTT